MTPGGQIGANRLPNPVFSDDYQQVRAVLVAARQAAGLSQRALARRVGRSATHICMIEIGQRRMDLLEFYRLAVALQADPRELFGEIAERLRSDATSLDQAGHDA